MKQLGRLNQPIRRRISKEKTYNVLSILRMIYKRKPYFKKLLKEPFQKYNPHHYTA
mgnify:CR=1 FL=1